MNMMKDKYRAHVALVIANVLFGLNYSYSKSIIPDSMTPLALAVLRVSVGAIMFLVAFRLMKEHPVERRDVPKLAVASILGLVANQFVFLQGLRYTSPVDASIITTVIPVLVLLISALFMREKITLFRSVGIVIGAAGALLAILYGGLSSLGEGTLTGNLLILFSSFCYAGYLVWTKPLMEKYNPLVIMTYMFTLGTLMTFPFFGFSLFRTDFGAITPGIWGAIIFVLVGTTFSAFFCVGYGLKRVKPTTVAIYQYMQPVVAAFFAIFRGQDTLNGVKILAAAMVFSGVFLVTQSARFEKYLPGGHGKTED